MAERDTELKNCRFKFKCPMKWDSLLKTENKSIRYCGKCDRGVHLCETEKELELAMENNHCVAIFVSEVKNYESSVPVHSIGEIAPVYDPNPSTKSKVELKLVGQDHNKRDGREPS